MKRGFTLVELLAVIVILSLLALITTTSITKLVKNSKNNLYDSQLLAIKTASESWGLENSYALLKNSSCAYITVGDLKSYGLLDESLIDSRTNKQISNDMKIKITKNTSKYGTTSYTYEVNPNNVEECFNIIGAIVYLDPTDISKTCTEEEIVSETGTKSGCMKWYIYSDSGNDMYKLILNHNTTAAIEWGSVQSDLNKLVSESNWSVTPELIKVDEIALVVGIRDALAWNSLKIYSEDYNVYSDDIYTKIYSSYFYLKDCKNSVSYNCWIESSTETSKYAWLYDYISDCTSEGCNISEAPNVTDGYWTNSLIFDYQESPNTISHYSGGYTWSIYKSKVIPREQTSYLGIRPVITLSKSVVTDKLANM